MSLTNIGPTIYDQVQKQVGPVLQRARDRQTLYWQSASSCISSKYECRESHPSVDAEAKQSPVYGKLEREKKIDVNNIQSTTQTVHNSFTECISSSCKVYCLSPDEVFRLLRIDCQYSPEKIQPHKTRLLIFLYPRFGL